MKIFERSPSLESEAISSELITREKKELEGLELKEREEKLRDLMETTTRNAFELTEGRPVNSSSSEVDATQILKWLKEEK